MTKPKRRRVSTAPSLASRRGWVAVGVILAMLVVGGLLWLNPFASASSTPLATLNTRDFHSLAFHPTNADMVFFGHHNGLMRSNDGGKTWQSVPTIQQDAMALAIHPAMPDLITAAGHNVLLQSADGGRSWRPLNTNLPGTDIHAFIVHPNDPKRFYAFVAGLGVFRSADGGARWERVSVDVPLSVIGIAAMPEPHESLYLATGEAGLLQSGDGGRTWTTVAADVLGRVVTAVTIEPRVGILYASSERGLFKSADRGNVWVRLHADATILALAISPSQPQRMMFVNQRGQVFRSDDGGNTWGSKP